MIVSTGALRASLSTLILKHQVVAVSQIGHIHDGPVQMRSQQRRQGRHG